MRNAPTATSPSPTRQRILVAASKLFSVQGYSGTSTRQIAEAVGITQPGLYRHFASKADVLLALATEVLSAGAEVADRHRNAAGSPAERLVQLVHELCVGLGESPYRTVFLLTERALVTDPAFESAVRLYRRWTRAIESILREGIEAGEFRQMEPRLAQSAIMSLTDLLILSEPGRTADKVQHIVDFAIRGVLADPSRADELSTHQ